MKEYVNDKGEKIFVAEGLQAGKWMAFRQKVNAFSKHRIKSSALPIRDNRDQAQADLEAYAAKHGLRMKVEPAR